TVTATVGLRLIVAVSDLVGSATLVARTVAVCAVGIEAGAVYSPLASIVPGPAITAQVTDVLLVPVTEAANCCVSPAVRFAVFGLTVTAIVGLRFTVAVSDLLVSATLVALTVAVCVVGIEAGAVYRPLALIVPGPAMTAQVTAVLLVPVTVAANC